MHCSHILRSLLLSLFLFLNFQLLNCVSISNPNTKMSYASLIQSLYKTNVFSPVKHGLENMMKLNMLLNNPLGNTPIIHVTGTNGKGSVSLKVSRCLRECGVKTGLFTSPHISSFKERVIVNEQLLAETDVESIFPEVFRLCSEHTIPATFFELTTALALVHFARSQCEAVVLEVGLGGRLDATNIVTPALSVITAIQLDHTKILGDTIEKIAMEKAGIMKPGVDVLVGPGCPIELLRAEAKRVGAIFHTLDDVLLHNERRYPVSLQDTADADIDDLNHDIALAALRLLQRPKPSGSRSSAVFSRLNDPSIDFNRALRTRPMCRFEVFPQRSAVSQKKVDVVLDIAHNEDALKTLVGKVKLVYPDTPVRLVVGMSSDKDVSNCIPHLARLVNHNPSKIHCTAATHPRALKIPELRSIFNNYILSALKDDPTIDTVKAQCETSAVLDGTIEQCVRNAVNSFDDDDAATAATTTTKDTETSQRPDGIVVVCGSAFIMSDARMELGVNEPRDSEELFFDLSKPSK